MLKRLRYLFRDFAGLFAEEREGPKNQVPVEVLAAEKENIRRLIEQYNQALASHADVCEQLMARGNELEQNAQALRVKTVDYLRAGNRESAGACALQLQDVERKQEEYRRHLEEAGTAYRELLAAREGVVRMARAKVEALQLRLDDLKVRQATAELADVASGVVSQIGAGGTLDRLTQMVNEERYRAMGRARVAQDLIGNADLAFKEYRQEATAEQALKDFAARAGLSLGGSEGEKLRE